MDARSVESLAQPRGQSDSQQLIHAYSNAAELYYYMRDGARVYRLGLELFALSVQHDLTGFTHQARLWVAWARLYQGKDDTDRSAVEATVAEKRRSDYWIDQTLWRSILAEILAVRGDVPGALQEVEEALAYADESGSAFWLAHLWTLKGDLLQRLNVPVVEIETCYHQALDLAQQQEAKSLELRAALALPVP